MARPCSTSIICGSSVATASALHPPQALDDLWINFLMLQKLWPPGSIAGKPGHLFGTPGCANVLHQLATAVKADIGVDIREAGTLWIQESFKVQPMLQRVDAGYPQGIQYNRAGSSTATRADRYPVGMCPAEYFLYLENIAKLPGLTDNGQFMLNPLPEFLRDNWILFGQASFDRFP